MQETEAELWNPLRNPIPKNQNLSKSCFSSFFFYPKYQGKKGKGKAEIRFAGGKITDPKKPLGIYPFLFLGRGGGGGGRAGCF